LCSRCRKWKGESQFGKNRRSKGGLSSWCRDCDQEYSRKCYKKAGRVLKKYYRYEERHRVVDGVKQKRCRKCKRWKTESEFYKNRLFKDGLQYRCKKCSDKATNKSHKKRRLAK
jgi:hypothetical protein